MTTVHIIDDNEAVRNAISMSLAMEGLETKEFSSAIEFLDEYNNQPGCVITDVEMPEMTGMQLQSTLKQRDIHIPVIFITGQGSISMSVKAMKSGAIDFIEKPFNKTKLLKSIQTALSIDKDSRTLSRVAHDINCRCNLLTSREKQILIMLIKDYAKLTNKDIAKLLGISKRTVEAHRGSIMTKMQANTRAELVELSRYCDLDNSR